MPVRLKDIAEDVGVSIITVSKALRNHPDISAGTRARVLKRIKELDYQPNFAARALATGRTFSAGLIVPDLVHPFFAELAKGLSEVLSAASYGLLISSSQESTELEAQQIDGMLARGVDALLVASTQLSPGGFKRIEEKGALCVLIDREFSGWNGNFVGIDDKRAGMLATEHLISVGCRRIAHVRGTQVSTGLGRLDGYLCALHGSGLESRTDYIASGETSDEQGDVSGYRAMQSLLEIDPKPDGVFCYNDPAAMGAMQAILDAGLRIPQDIAVIGCGNVLYSQFLRVPLSSVDQQSTEMGRRAGKLTLSHVGRKRKRKPERILLEPRLIARNSTARQSV
jgi:LacI family transcriptional regulator